MEIQILPDINEIKKDLYKTKENAEFSFYRKGQLFYEVNILGNRYSFPLNVVENTSKEVSLVKNLKTEKNGLGTKVAIDVVTYVDTIKLSDDLGNTDFNRDIKGSELIRWITKAIDNGNFVKIKSNV